MRKIHLTAVCCLIFGISWAQNQAPIFSNPGNITIQEGAYLEISLNATDPDELLKINDPSIVVMGTSTADGSKASPDKGWVDLFDNYLTANVQGAQLHRLTIGSYTTYHFREDGYVPIIPGRAAPDPTYSISRAVEFNPDIIVINMPSNDVSNGLDKEETYTNYQAFEDHANDIGATIFFHTNQPRNFTNQNERLELYNKAQDILDMYGDRAINTYDDLVDYSTYGLKPEYNADNVHPNNAGHEVIYNRNLESLKHLLLGDEVHFEADNLPPFISIENVSSGIGKLVMSPTFENEGFYQLTIDAVDLNGNKTQREIDIVVEPNTPKGGTQELKQYTHSVNNGGTLEYYVYYPEQYDFDSLNKPVLISLHGNAERDGPASMVITAEEGEGSPAYLAEQGMEFPLMIISPHQETIVGNKTSYYWDLNLVKDLVEHVKSRYNVDENRIYLTGFSNGGQTAWQYAVDYPDDIAALMPAAGNTDLRGLPQYGINLANAQYACVLNNIPIQAWHGSNDQIVDLAQSINMVNAVNNCDSDPNAALITVAGSDHHIRNSMYNNVPGNNIYDWMLQFSKGTEPTDVFAPEFINSSPYISNLTDQSFEVTIALNEPGTVFYALYEGNSSPDINNIIMGDGENMLSSGNTSITSPITLPFLGLDHETSYTIGVVAEDISQNLQASPTLIAVNTLEDPGDFSAPSFVVEPTISDLKSGSSQINVQIDESGIIYWALFPQNHNPIQDEVLTGINSLMNGEMTTHGELESIYLSGLMKDTPYLFALIAVDDESPVNIQTDIHFQNFGTKNVVGEQEVRVYNLNITKNSGPSNLNEWNDIFVNNINGSLQFTPHDTELNPAAFYLEIPGNKIDNVADNWTNYGSGSIYPKPLLRYVGWTTRTGELYFNDLDPGKTYTFTLFASRKGSGTRITKYTLANETRTLQVMNNLNNTVVFNEMSPSNSGSLKLSFTKETSSYGYLSTVVIEEKTEEPGDTNPPLAVTGLALSYNSTTNAITASWDSSTETDFSKYAIYRDSEGSISYDNSDLLQAGLNQNNFDDHSVLTGTTYYYWIVALDVSGNPSEIQEAKSIDIPDPNIVIAPVLSPIVATTTSLTLSWLQSESPNIDQYEIHRSTDNINFELLAAVDNDVLSYVDFDVTQDITYYYGLKTVDSENNLSHLSNVESGLLEIPILLQNPPVLNAASLDSNLEVELTWSHSVLSGFSHFQVYRSTEEFESINEATLVGNDIISTTFVDSDISEKVTYHYRLTSLNHNNEESDPSNSLEIYIPDVTAPSAPSNLSATSTQDVISLTWELSISDDVAQHVLYRSTEALDLLSTGNELVILPSDIYSYQDLNTIQGIVYYYAVLAIDTAGNPSNSSNIPIISLIDAIPPSPPSGFMGQIGTTNSITLNWDENSETDLASYQIYRAEFDFEDSNEAQYLGETDVTTFVDSSPEESKKYYYRLTATDLNNNQSSLSSKVILETYDLTPPNPPVLTAVTGLSQSMRLDWEGSESSDFSHYNIYVSSQNDEPAIRNGFIESVESNTFDYEFTEENISLYFIITAVDNSGNESLSSNILEAQILNELAPVAPSGVSAQLVNRNNITLSWDGNSENDLLGYNLYRSLSANFDSEPAHLIAENISDNAYEDNNLDFITTYYYLLTAVDVAHNESLSTDVIAISTEEETPAEPVLTQTIKINMKKNNFSSSLSEWNHLGFDIAKGGDNLFGLKEISGASTSKQLVAWDRHNSSIIESVADNGSNLNNGVLPNDVLKHTAYTTNIGKMSLQNLDPSNTYSIQFHSGRAGGGSRITEFTVNGFSQQIESINNKNNLLDFNHISPNPDGTIDISFATTNASYAYINAIIIKEYSVDESLRKLDNREKFNINSGGIKDNFSFYPNPTSGIVNFVWSTTIENELSISIYDSSGKKVYRGIFEPTELMSIPLTLKQGVYLLEVSSSDLHETKRLIITN